MYKILEIFAIYLNNIYINENYTIIYSENELKITIYCGGNYFYAKMYKSFKNAIFCLTLFFKKDIIIKLFDLTDEVGGYSELW